MQRDAQATKAALPNDLKSLFWDYNFEDLSWDEDRTLIIRRILISGPWNTVQWLRTRLSNDELRHWIIDHRGRGLSPQQLRFWQLILDLPAQQVDAWLTDQRSNPWHHRHAS